jgi:hypothetical protein
MRSARSWSKSVRPPHPDNIARAERLYARAQSEAAFKTLPAETDEFDFAALVEEAQTSPPSIAWSTHGATSALDTGHDGKAKSAMTAPRQLGGPPQVADDTASDMREATTGLRVMDVARSLSKDKVKKEEWTAKTQSQFFSICDLLDRFLRQECSIGDLRDLRQPHLHRFKQFLLHELGKSYGKSPADLKASIAELKRKANALPVSKRGLEAGALGRHFTFLDQLLERVRLEGTKLDAELKFSRFKPKSTGRARDQREIPKQPIIAQLFTQPVYLGCRDWDEPFEPGDNIYHRAAYFGPCLPIIRGCGVKSSAGSSSTKSCRSRKRANASRTSRCGTTRSGA